MPRVIDSKLTLIHIPLHWGLINFLPLRLSPSSSSPTKRLQKSMHKDGKIKCLYLFEDTKIMGKLFGFRLQRAAPHFFTVQLYESMHSLAC